MKFTVSIKEKSIYVKIHGPDPWKPQSFFPLIDRLFGRIKDVYEQHKYPVVFDFLDIHFIDSYMISMLVQTSRLTDPKKNSLIVSDKQVISIINILGINRMINIFSSKEKWLKKRNKSGKRKVALNHRTKGKNQG